MSEVKLQVYLLAENRLFREALSRILNKRNDIRVVGAASFSNLLLEAVAELRPDILLSDAGALSGPQSTFLPQLRKLLPQLKVIMIGMDADEESFLRSVRQGAVGYVLKDASATEVATAVRAVINNEAFCPPSLLLTLFSAVSNPRMSDSIALVKRKLGLSRREQQLTRMIGEGLTNKEIASQLNLSEFTVRNHIHRILKQVDAASRSEAVQTIRSYGYMVS